MTRLWLLRLVPSVRSGRWLSALTLFAAMFVVLASARSVMTMGQSYNWSIALFFCVIVAYITPIFHFISYRTEEAFDNLQDLLSLDPEHLARLRLGICHKSYGWVMGNAAIAVGLWLLQSWLLAGGTEAMLATLTRSAGSFTVAASTLVVWLTMTCAVHALIDNARLFRRLTKHIEVDVLDTRALTPFGSMAVSSTLVVIGAQASFSIMWLGTMTNPWTTIPGMIPTTGALLFLFFAPVWPIHVALKRAKQIELAHVQSSINRMRESDALGYNDMSPLLSYRREILSIREWPFDVGVVTRLGLYLVIVPLTWIGAALIENLVDLFIA